jgi:hypothetical protein
MNKQIALLGIVLSLAACGTRKASPQKPGTGSEQGEASSELNLPPLIESENLPQSELPRVERYGVLIRAIGLDAFAALGFLQEMEKRGFKIDFVAGTGFGCWITRSWAARNKGNFAEWQSFKFDNWSALQNSLIDRVSSRNAANRFHAYLEKILSTQKQTHAAIDWACPLFLKENGKWRIVSGGDMVFSENLMKQMELTAMDFGPYGVNKDFFSGSVSDYPLARWIEALDALWTDEAKENRAWIVLDTRFVFAQWKKTVNSADAGILQDSLRWARYSVGKSNFSDPQMMKNFERRRDFLLQGRQSAKEFFDHPRYQQFFAW